MSNWFGNNFPVGTNPLETRRHVLTDYGNMGGVDVLPLVGEDFATVRQKQHWGNSKVQLCATGPTLPLIPPNPVNHLSYDPCMGELKANRKELLRLHLELLRKQGHAKCDPEYRHKFKSFLKDLQSLRSGVIRDDVLSDYVLNQIPTSFKNFTNAAFRLFRQPPFVPEVNSAYSGGGIVYQSRQNESGLLLYPRAARMDTLTCSVVRLKDKAEVLGTRQVEQTNGRILQIDSSSVANSYFCCMRTEESQCDVFQTGDSGTDVRWQHMHSKTWTESNPTNICLSSCIPGESLVTMDTGEIYLWSSQNSLEKVVTGLKHRFTCYEDWWSACYAGHPRLITVTDRTGVAIHDIRCKPSTCEDLFSLPHCELHPNERVMACMPHPSNPLYHVAAMGVTLALLDQRVPTQPVLTWRQSLEHPPLYLDIAPNVSLDGDLNDVLLLGHPFYPDVCAYQFKLAQSSLPPVSTSRPWKLSQASDILTAGVLQQYKVSHHILLNRLDATLAGVCAETHPDRNGFTAFQLTVLGDMFFQTYVPTADRRDKTLCSGPGCLGSSVLPGNCDDLSQWMKSTLEMAEAELKDQMENREAGRVIDATLTYKGIESASIPNIHCPFCMSATARSVAETPSTSQEEEETCLKCGYDTSKSTQIINIVEEGHAAAEARDGDPALPDHIDSFDPTQYPDSFSKLLLQLWDEEDITDLIHEMDKERGEAKRLRAEKRKEKQQTDESKGESVQDEEEEEEEEESSSGSSSDSSGTELDEMRDLLEQLANGKTAPSTSGHITIPDEHSYPSNSKENIQNKRMMKKSSVVGRVVGQDNQSIPHHSARSRHDSSSRSVSSAASSIRSSGSAAGFLATPRRMHLNSSRSPSNVGSRCISGSPLIEIPKFGSGSNPSGTKPRSTEYGFLTDASFQNLSSTQSPRLDSSTKKVKKKKSVMGF